MSLNPKAGLGESDENPRALDRTACWNVARGLGGRNASVWAIEYLKAAQVQTERQPGLIHRALRRPPGRWNVLQRWATFWLAAIIAGVFYLGYAAKISRRALRQRLPEKPRRAVAVHAEWSTRTRHVLNAVPSAEPPIDFVVLLGRVQMAPSHPLAIWREHIPQLGDMPVLVPFSGRAFIRALRKIFPKLRQGAADLRNAPLKVTLRDQMAIAFRVMNGLVAAEWWVKAKIHVHRDTAFGITGTADTTLLERAIQLTGCKTVHAVHGQATGPNFFGISDVALFRTGYDSEKYAALGCYGRSLVQEGTYRERARGKSGVLVFTNLSHPVNQAFLANGIQADAAFLQEIAHALDNSESESGARFWKPHPAIDSIPLKQSKALRRLAKFHGFKELKAADDMLDLLGEVRWILSTPSTVLLDLLDQGVCCVLVDPLKAVTDEAISEFPSVACESDKIRFLFGPGHAQPNQKDLLKQLFSKIKPARELSLDLSTF